MSVFQGFSLILGHFFMLPFWAGYFFTVHTLQEVLTSQIPRHHHYPPCHMATKNKNVHRFPGTPRVADNTSCDWEHVLRVSIFENCPINQGTFCQRREEGLATEQVWAWLKGIHAQSHPGLWSVLLVLVHLHVTLLYKCHLRIVWGKSLGSPVVPSYSLAIGT